VADGKNSTTGRTDQNIGPTQDSSQSDSGVRTEDQLPDTDPQKANLQDSQLLSGTGYALIALIAGLIGVGVLLFYIYKVQA
jgi:hypothetical protein